MSVRLALAVALLAGPVAFAQIQIDDRPKPIDDDKPLTKDELNRRKADQLLREARARFGVGIMSQRQERLIEAVSTFEKAAKLDPESLEIRRALIPLYAIIGREEEARTLARHVLDRDPFDLETAFQYARLLRVDGRAAEAVPVLQKAAGGKDAQERPERLLFLLSDLFDLLEKQGDFAGAAKAEEGIIKTITEKREQLLYGNGFTRDDLQASLARAYEGLGRACVKTKEYDRAVAAFRGARDTLLKSDDPDAKHQAVRISLNVSEVAASQGKWAEALEALDAYLDHGPAEVAPYETKIELLKKLGREKDVVPTLRKYAAKEEFNLGLQLLLARELAKDPATRREAETIYTDLLKTNVKPEVYRGLFELYRAEDRMVRAVDFFDEAKQTAQLDVGKVTVTAREAAAVRVQAMQTALRKDRELTEAFLREAVAELALEKNRSTSTWLVLATLAAQGHQLKTAEDLFRPCLRNPPRNNEAFVYTGLVGVLMAQRKYDDVAAICKSALSGPRPRNVSANYLESWLAEALARQGDFEQALVHADRAIKGTNDDIEVDFRCEKAAILAQAERFDDAVSECQETLKKFTRLKNVLQIRQTLSNVYSLKGDHSKSEEQLRLILEMDPDIPLANNNLGYQMADRNMNLDEAERLIRRAVELDRSLRKQVDEEGENAAYVDSLGWVLFRKGKLAEAREWIEKAVALPDGADDPTVWDHLGDVYAKLDQPAKAKEAWQKAVKLYDTAGRKKTDPKKTEIEKKLKTLD
jgi:tetratricopeptide (TPR) repeat protein